MITRFFARSLKNAHQRWQQLEADMADSHRNLARPLEITKMAAQTAGVDSPEEEGILRGAYNFTAAPLPKKLLGAHTAISKAFAILGKSFWRSTPQNLREILNNFATLMAERRRECDALCQELHAVCTVLDTLGRHPEYAFNLSPRIVLRNPKVAEGLLQLGKELWKTRQVSLIRLQRGLLNRINIGFGWLEVLQSNI
jgi:hypothetical protein